MHAASTNLAVAVKVVLEELGEGAAAVVLEIGAAALLVAAQLLLIVRQTTQHRDATPQCSGTASSATC